MEVTPCQTKKTKRQILKSQARVLVNRLYNYILKDNKNKGTIKPPMIVAERVAEALQISKSTVLRIVGESKTGELVTPGKNVVRKSPKSGVDSLDENGIRQHIYNYYEKKEWPTVSKLVQSLSTANLFHGKSTTLSIILKKLNFRWKAIKNKKLLLERRDIIITRCLFLSKIQQYDIEKVIFLDETWVNVGHCVTNNLTDGTTKVSAKVPIGKGGRLILAHAGSAQGFIQDSCLLFQCKSTGEYHQDINTETFKGWFNDLLDKLPSGSVIAMDNALYHSVIKDKSPTTCWKKHKIQNWLTKNKVNWSIDMLKGQLMDLVNLNKPRKKKYVLDELAKKKGCTVIRLPPYHSQFNPMEMIWAQVKGYVASKNKTCRMCDVELLVKEAIESVTANDWKRCVQHTAEVIKKARKHEGMVELMLDEMIIQVGDRNSSSGSDSEGTDSAESYYDSAESHDSEATDTAEENDLI